MASQVTAKQFSPLRRVNLPIDSLHKMDRKHHEGLLKKMYMPFVRGPENRHFFASFEDKNSNSFLKFNPYSSPEANDYPLAPHRDDVPIINPCSGFLSPGAGADEKITPQRDGPDGRSPAKASVPHRRTQSAHIKPSLLSEELKLDRRWNSRALLDVALKARLTGWTSPGKSSEPSKASREEKARKYMYTTMIQRGYEEVPWDKMLPPKVQPPDSTLEPTADCVSQGFPAKRFEPVPEISQVVGGLWDRFQTRSFTVPHRPINFVSTCSRTQHIPSYTGCVGAKNVEDLDNPNVDLIYYGNVRITQPHYAKTSYSPNTFGYTGKVHWSATQPANSNLPPVSPSIISRMHGYMAKHEKPSEFPHLGPLSQIVTTTEPKNSFNKKERERLKF